MTSPTATHCVLCGFDAVFAPRIHLRDLSPDAATRDVVLGLCEVHGGRLRKGELRVLMVVETWLTAEHRFHPNNPLHGIRLVACCLACDAPLDVDSAGDRSRSLPSGEFIVTCSTCPMGNVIESIGGDPAAVRLWQAPARPRPA
jgi:hypothetical protein